MFALVVAAVLAVEPGRTEIVEIFRGDFTDVPTIHPGCGTGPDPWRDFAYAKRSSETNALLMELSRTHHSALNALASQDDEVVAEFFRRRFSSESPDSKARRVAGLYLLNVSETERSRVVLEDLGNRDPEYDRRIINTLMNGKFGLSETAQQKLVDVYLRPTPRAPTKAEVARNFKPPADDTPTMLVDFLIEDEVHRRRPLEKLEVAKALLILAPERFAEVVLKTKQRELFFRRDGVAPMEVLVNALPRASGQLHIEIDQLLAARINAIPFGSKEERELKELGGLLGALKNAPATAYAMQLFSQRG